MMVEHGVPELILARVLLVLSKNQDVFSPFLRSLPIQELEMLYSLMTDTDVVRLYAATILYFDD